jgi:hypothetical protein
MIITTLLTILLLAGVTLLPPGDLLEAFHELAAPLNPTGPFPEESHHRQDRSV